MGEKEFNVMEDLIGHVFTYDDVRGLKAGEGNRFRDMMSSKRIKFIAGTVTTRKDGVVTKKIVNKKKLTDLGMDLDVHYYMFVRGWKDPVMEAFKVQKAAEDKFDYMERRVYADSVDNMVEEAIKLKERKRIRKLEYEEDNSRGWVTVDEIDQSKRRQKLKIATNVDGGAWKGADDVKEEKKKDGVISAEEWK